MYMQRNLFSYSSLASVHKQQLHEYDLTLEMS